MDSDVTQTSASVLTSQPVSDGDGSPEAAPAVDSVPSSSSDAGSVDITSRKKSSDDPISSTSDVGDRIEFGQSAKVNKSDLDNEADIFANECNLSDMSTEKITENVEDIVTDLENLLGNSTEDYSVPVGKSRKSESMPELDDLLFSFDEKKTDKGSISDAPQAGSSQKQDPASVGSKPVLCVAESEVAGTPVEVEQIHVFQASVEQDENKNVQEPSVGVRTETAPVPMDVDDESECVVPQITPIESDVTSDSKELNVVPIPIVDVCKSTDIDLPEASPSSVIPESPDQQSNSTDKKTVVIKDVESKCASKSNENDTIDIKCITDNASKLTVALETTDITDGPESQKLTVVDLKSSDVVTDLAKPIERMEATKEQAEKEPKTIDVIEEHNVASEIVLKSVPRNSKEATISKQADAKSEAAEQQAEATSRAAEQQAEATISEQAEAKSGAAEHPAEDKNKVRPGSLQSSSEKKHGKDTDESQSAVDSEPLVDSSTAEGANKLKLDENIELLSIAQDIKMPTEVLLTSKLPQGSKASKIKEGGVPSNVAVVEKSQIISNISDPKEFIAEAANKSKLVVDIKKSNPTEDADSSKHTKTAKDLVNTKATDKTVLEDAPHTSKDADVSKHPKDSHETKVTDGADYSKLPEETKKSCTSKDANISKLRDLGVLNVTEGAEKLKVAEDTKTLKTAEDTSKNLKKLEESKIIARADKSKLIEDTQITSAVTDNTSKHLDGSVNTKGADKLKLPEDAISNTPDAKTTKDPKQSEESLITDSKLLKDTNKLETAKDTDTSKDPKQFVESSITDSNLLKDTSKLETAVHANTSKDSKHLNESSIPEGGHISKHIKDTKRFEKTHHDDMEVANTSEDIKKSILPENMPEVTKKTTVTESMEVSYSDVNVLNLQDSNANKDSAQANICENVETVVTKKSKLKEDAKKPNTAAESKTSELPAADVKPAYLIDMKEANTSKLLAADIEKPLIHEAKKDAASSKLPLPAESTKKQELHAAEVKKPVLHVAVKDKDTDKKPALHSDVKEGKSSKPLVAEDKGTDEKSGLLADVKEAKSSKPLAAEVKKPVLHEAVKDKDTDKKPALHSDVKEAKSSKPLVAEDKGTDKNSGLLADVKEAKSSKPLAAEVKKPVVHEVVKDKDTDKMPALHSDVKEAKSSKPLVAEDKGTDEKSGLLADVKEAKSSKPLAAEVKKPVLHEAVKDKDTDKKPALHSDVKEAKSSKPLVAEDKGTDKNSGLLADVKEAKSSKPLAAEVKKPVVHEVVKDKDTDKMPALHSDVKEAKSSKPLAAEVKKPVLHEAVKDKDTDKKPALHSGVKEAKSSKPLVAENKGTDKNSGLLADVKEAKSSKPLAAEVKKPVVHEAVKDKDTDKMPALHSDVKEAKSSKPLAAEVKKPVLHEAVIDKDTDKKPALHSDLKEAKSSKPLLAEDKGTDKKSGLLADVKETKSSKPLAAEVKKPVLHEAVKDQDTDKKPAILSDLKEAKSSKPLAAEVKKLVLHEAVKDKDTDKKPTLNADVKEAKSSKPLVAEVEKSVLHEAVKDKDAPSKLPAVDAEKPFLHADIKVAKPSKSLAADVEKPVLSEAVKDKDTAKKSGLHADVKQAIPSKPLAADVKEANTSKPLAADVKKPFLHEAVKDKDTDKKPGLPADVKETKSSKPLAADVEKSVLHEAVKDKDATPSKLPAVDAKKPVLHADIKVAKPSMPLATDGEIPVLGEAVKDIDSAKKSDLHAGMKETKSSKPLAAGDKGTDKKRGLHADVKEAKSSKPLVAEDKDTNKNPDLHADVKEAKSSKPLAADVKKPLLHEAVKEKDTERKPGLPADVKETKSSKPLAADVEKSMLHEAVKDKDAAPSKLPAVDVKKPVLHADIKVAKPSMPLATHVEKPVLSDSVKDTAIKSGLHAGAKETKPSKPLAADVKEAKSSKAIAADVKKPLLHEAVKDKDTDKKPGLSADIKETKSSKPVAADVEKSVLHEAVKDKDAVPSKLPAVDVEKPVLHADIKVPSMPLATEVEKHVLREDVKDKDTAKKSDLHAGVKETKPSKPLAADVKEANSSNLLAADFKKPLAADVGKPVLHEAVEDKDTDKKLGLHADMKEAKYSKPLVVEDKNTAKQAKSSKPLAAEDKHSDKKSALGADVKEAKSSKPLAADIKKPVLHESVKDKDTVKVATSSKLPVVDVEKPESCVDMKADTAPEFLAVTIEKPKLHRVVEDKDATSSILPGDAENSHLHVEIKEAKSSKLPAVDVVKPPLIAEMKGSKLAKPAAKDAENPELDEHLKDTVKDTKLSKQPAIGAGKSERIVRTADITTVEDIITSKLSAVDVKKVHEDLKGKGAQSSKLPAVDIKKPELLPMKDATTAENADTSKLCAEGAENRKIQEDVKYICTVKDVKSSKFPAVDVKKPDLSVVKEAKTVEVATTSDLPALNVQLAESVLITDTAKNIKSSTKPAVKDVKTVKETTSNPPAVDVKKAESVQITDAAKDIKSSTKPLVENVKTVEELTSKSLTVNIKNAESVQISDAAKDIKSSTKPEVKDVKSVKEITSKPPAVNVKKAESVQITDAAIDVKSSAVRAVDVKKIESVQITDAAKAGKSSTVEAAKSSTVGAVNVKKPELRVELKSAKTVTEAATKTIPAVDIKKAESVQITNTAKTASLPAVDVKKPVLDEAKKDIKTVTDTTSKLTASDNKKSNLLSGKDINIKIVEKPQMSEEIISSATTTNVKLQVPETNQVSQTVPDLKKLPIEKSSTKDVKITETAEDVKELNIVIKSDSAKVVPEKPHTTEDVKKSKLCINTAQTTTGDTEKHVKVSAKDVTLADSLKDSTVAETAEKTRSSALPTVLNDSTTIEETGRKDSIESKISEEPVTPKLLKTPIEADKPKIPKESIETKITKETATLKLSETPIESKTIGEAGSKRKLIKESIECKKTEEASTSKLPKNLHEPKVITEAGKSPLTKESNEPEIADASDKLQKKLPNESKISLEAVKTTLTKDSTDSKMSKEVGKAKHPSELIEIKTTKAVDKVAKTEEKINRAETEKLKAPTADVKTLNLQDIESSNAAKSDTSDLIEDKPKPAEDTKVIQIAIETTLQENMETTNIPEDVKKPTPTDDSKSKLSQGVKVSSTAEGVKEKLEGSIIGAGKSKLPEDMVSIGGKKETNPPETMKKIKIDKSKSSVSEKKSILPASNSAKCDTKSKVLEKIEGPSIAADGSKHPKDKDTAEPTKLSEESNIDVNKSKIAGGKEIVLTKDNKKSILPEKSIETNKSKLSESTDVAKPAKLVDKSSKNLVKSNVETEPKLLESEDTTSTGKSAERANLPETKTIIFADGSKHPEVMDESNISQVIIQTKPEGLEKPSIVAGGKKRKLPDDFEEPNVSKSARPTVDKLAGNANISKTTDEPNNSKAADKVIPKPAEAAKICKSTAEANISKTADKTKLPEDTENVKESSTGKEPINLKGTTLAEVKKSKPGVGETKPLLDASIPAKPVKVVQNVDKIEVATCKNEEIIQESSSKEIKLAVPTDKISDIVVQMPSSSGKNTKEDKKIVQPIETLTRIEEPSKANSDSDVTDKFVNTLDAITEEGQVTSDSAEVNIKESDTSSTNTSAITTTDSQQEPHLEAKLSEEEKMDIDNSQDLDKIVKIVPKAQSKILEAKPTDLKNTIENEPSGSSRILQAVLGESKKTIDDKSRDPGKILEVMLQDSSKTTVVKPKDKSKNEAGIKDSSKNIEAASGVSSKTDKVNAKPSDKTPEVKSQNSTEADKIKVVAPNSSKTIGAERGVSVKVLRTVHEDSVKAPETKHVELNKPTEIKSKDVINLVKTELKSTSNPIATECKDSICVLETSQQTVAKDASEEVIEPEDEKMDTSNDGQIFSTVEGSKDEEFPEENMDTTDRPKIVKVLKEKETTTVKTQQKPQKAKEEQKKAQQMPQKGKEEQKKAQQLPQKGKEEQKKTSNLKKQEILQKGKVELIKTSAPKEKGTTVIVQEEQKATSSVQEIKQIVKGEKQPSVKGDEMDNLVSSTQKSDVLISVGRQQKPPCVPTVSHSKETIPRDIASEQTNKIVLLPAGPSTQIKTAGTSKIVGDKLYAKTAKAKPDEVVEKTHKNNVKAVEDAVKTVKDTVKDVKSTVKGIEKIVEDAAKDVKDTENDAKDAVKDIKDVVKDVNDTEEDVKDAVKNVTDTEKNVKQSVHVVEDDLDISDEEMEELRIESDDEGTNPELDSTVKVNVAEPSKIIADSVVNDKKTVSDEVIPQSKKTAGLEKLSNVKVAKSIAKPGKVITRTAVREASRVKDAADKMPARNAKVKGIRHTRVTPKRTKAAAGKDLKQEVDNTDKDVSVVKVSPNVSVVKVSPKKAKALAAKNLKQDPNKINKVEKKSVERVKKLPMKRSARVLRKQTETLTRAAEAAALNKTKVSDVRKEPDVHLENKNNEALTPTPSQDVEDSSMPAGSVPVIEVQQEVNPEEELVKAAFEASFDEDDGYEEPKESVSSEASEIMKAAEDVQRYERKEEEMALIQAAQESQNREAEEKTLLLAASQAESNRKSHKQEEYKKPLNIVVDSIQNSSVSSASVIKEAESTSCEDQDVPQKEVSSDDDKPSEYSSKINQNQELKLTIRKTKTEEPSSILKIYDPKNPNPLEVSPSESETEPEEAPIPKLIIKQCSPKAMSPLKITIKPVLKPEEQPIQKSSPKLIIKPIIKPDDEDKVVEERHHSPKITIKHILKPADDCERSHSPKITIKPIIKPSEASTSPKIKIKPIIKPEEETMVDEDEGKERIVLKINKSNIPHKEVKKVDENEKLAKIKLKFTKGGGHAHIVNDESVEVDRPNLKRPNPDEPETEAKKQKLELHAENIPAEPTTSSQKPEAANAKSDKIETRSRQSLSLTESPKPETPPVVAASAPRKRGRPRKNPLVVREEFKDPKDAEPEVVVVEGAPDQPPETPSGRPKRSCRGPSVRTTLGIKPKKPRGGGRGRGRGRGGAAASVVAADDVGGSGMVTRGGRIEKEPKKGKISESKLKLIKEAAITAQVKESLENQDVEFKVELEVEVKEEVKPVDVEPEEPKIVLPEEIEVKAEEIEVKAEEKPSEPSPVKQELEEIPPVITTDVVMYEEETRMSADTNNSRAQTPAKQVLSSTVQDVVEESQSSVQSTATTESAKVRKGHRLEVHQEVDSSEMSAEQLAEYYWGNGGPYMLQEQVAQFLGIKSFKRKYPGIQRRPVDMQERDFIRESSLASENMCDLGLTAVLSADILDIMYTDFQPKYEEYCKHLRDKQTKDITNKQKALSLAASQEKNKLDIMQQAVESAAQWNAGFNKSRKEERKACMDLQTFTINFPRGRCKVPGKPKLGNYPIALVPGQYTDYYKPFTPTELNNLPLNTMLYHPININNEDDSQSDGSGSESDSSSSGSDSSDSDSTDEDCNICSSSAGSGKKAVM